MLALGTVPVSFYEFAFPGEVGGPWATELLDGQTPVVLKGELNVEQVAALQPDLIIGLNQALTQQQYDQLSVIAPTLARPAEYTDYGVPPMVQAELIGQAFGKSAEIDALGARVQTSSTTPARRTRSSRARPCRWSGRSRTAAGSPGAPPTPGCS